MLLDFVNKEISGLKDKQSQVLQQIQAVQKELQRLQDTNLVISGALQALTHVLEQDQKSMMNMSMNMNTNMNTAKLPPIPEEESKLSSTSSSVREAASAAYTHALNQVVDDPDMTGF